MNSVDTVVHQTLTQRLLRQRRSYRWLADMTSDLVVHRTGTTTPWFGKLQSGSRTWG
jgi:hypothetical protein